MSRRGDSATPTPSTPNGGNEKERRKGKRRGTAFRSTHYTELISWVCSACTQDALWGRSLAAPYILTRLIFDHLRVAFYWRPPIGRSGDRGDTADPYKLNHFLIRAIFCHAILQLAIATQCKLITVSNDFKFRLEISSKRNRILVRSDTIRSARIRIKKHTHLIT